MVKEIYNLTYLIIFQLGKNCLHEKYLLIRNILNEKSVEIEVKFDDDEVMMAE